MRRLICCSAVFLTACSPVPTQTSSVETAEVQKTAFTAQAGENASAASSGAQTPDARLSAQTQQKVSAAFSSEPTTDANRPVSCSGLALPPSSEPNISCRQNADGFCAHFENGKMFYCQTTDGTRAYQSNKWASSLTFTRRDAQGRTQNLYYYAYGKLARTEEYDYAGGVVTRVWYNPSQIRLTRTALDGRVLDKYYFTEGKPYVRYPGGNDMGEINGEWRLEGNQLITDGQQLYTLTRPTQPQWTTGWELIK